MAPPMPLQNGGMGMYTKDKESNLLGEVRDLLYQPHHRAGWQPPNSSPIATNTKPNQQTYHTITSVSATSDSICGQDELASIAVR
eukprot:scaffold70358_cov69-Cyclotella_meneghiniana.AAC.4